jgi:hypothetical protein
MALGFILPHQIPFIWKGLMWTDATFCNVQKGATSNLTAFRFILGAYAAWQCLRTSCPVGGSQARLGPRLQSLIRWGLTKDQLPYRIDYYIFVLILQFHSLFSFFSFGYILRLVL